MINVQANFNYNVNKSSQNVVKIPYGVSLGEHAKCSFVYSAVPNLESIVDLKYSILIGLQKSVCTFHYNIRSAEATSKIIVRKQNVS